MQTTDTVLMVEPIAFGYNAETAKNNYFQVNSENDKTQEKALVEFQNFVSKLRSRGVNVVVIKDTLKPHTPDSIFPNNWVSFNKEGKVFLYPMYAQNRRDERRNDIFELLKNEGFQINSIEDWSTYEAENIFLEGTGSMIFDHDYKIAYGSVSLRLDEALFRKYCESIGYKPIVFHSFQTANNERLPIYHTNVMMCVADKYVVICLDCIDDEAERKQVADTILSTHKEIIEITEAQLQQFAGNMLQVQNTAGEKFLVMSQSAYRSLSQEQIQNIEKYNEIIYSDLNTIETNGGGSARCMLAEIFLPKSL